MLMIVSFFAVASTYYYFALRLFGNHWTHATKHTLVLAACIHLTYSIWSLLGRSKRPWSKFWQIFSAALLFWALALAYGASFISNAYWGDNMTLAVLWRFVPEYRQVGALVGLPAWIVIAVPLVPLGLLTVFYYCFSARMDREALAWSSWRVFGLAGWALLLLIIVDSTVGGSRFWDDDPVVNLCGAERQGYRMTPMRLKAAALDDADRKKAQLVAPSRRTIILFIVDALRADHLPVYGYARPLTPNLDRHFLRWRPQLAPDALALAPESRGGIITLLSAKPFSQHSHRSYTLPDAVADQGFRSNLILAGDHRWYNFKDAYGKKIDHLTDGSDPANKHGMNGDWRLVDEVEALPHSDGSPQFFYFHLMSVHDSGYLEQRFKVYQPTLSPATHVIRKKPFDSTEHQSIVNLYDNRILQADSVVGALMEALEKKGYLKSFVACLTADHGEGLGEHGSYCHGQNIYQEFIHIPMIFWGKELPALEGLGNANQLDVAPTLVDLAGLSIPSNWQGHTLRKKMLGPRFTAHQDPFNRISRGGIVWRGPKTFYKYIRPMGTIGGKGEEFYDLLRDPKEADNMIRNAPQSLLEEMRRLGDRELSN